MDIYKLINSKAVSEHCRKIEHKFNTEELAVLIYRNRSMDIKEKIQVYQELINDYPDMEVIERINCKHYNSAKDMIKGEIDRLQELSQEMKVIDENMIYTAKILYAGSKGFEKSDNFYKTYEEVCKAITEEMKDYENYPILMYKIIKRSFLRDKRQIIEDYIVDTNHKVKLINISNTNEFLDIDNICLNIPTPFKKGDILVSDITSMHTSGTAFENGKYIFVLDWLCNWNDNFQKLLDKGNYDASDMNGTGYSFLEDDELWWDQHFDYDSFEYYDGKLDGVYRLLKAISSLMKGEIGPDLFLEAYKYITAEKQIKNAFWAGFTDDSLQLSGLNKEDMEKIKRNA